MSVIAPQVSLDDNVICFTTSVNGGMSEGVYASLNVGAHVHDKNSHVLKNRQILHAYLMKHCIEGNNQLGEFPWLNQQHSNSVVSADDALLSPKVIADGSFTDVRFQPLVVMTADCLPIVLASTRTNKIVALHAGWRGLLSNIIREGINCFAKDEPLNAWIGPSISQQHFEIGQDIVANFKDYPQCIKSAAKNKYLINLQAIAEQQLSGSNIQHITKSTVCTYASNACFSHRRAQHQGHAQTGRMATVVIRY